jgi:hypothetical protein
MSPTSSTPIVTVGSLRQYGLIEDEGAGPTRKIRVTPDALRIIMDKIPTSESRMAALQRAFFSPKIYIELWNNWKADLPSDQTVLNYLILERKLSGQAPFSEQAASELLASYKASMAFAPPSDALTVSPSIEANGETVNMETSVAQTQHAEMPPQPIAAPTAKVRLAENERVVFVEESEPNQYLKVVASGEVDEVMLDALSDYVRRQKKRLGIGTVN